MQIRQRYQPRLIGLSLGVILALLIWPATRQLVWSQFALSVPTPVSAAPWSGQAENNKEAWRTAQRRYHETALRHPDDYQIQFADAVVVAPAGEDMTPRLRVQRLHDLIVRFPNIVPLYAAALRFATQEQIRVDREEEKWVAGESGSRKTVSGPPHNRPKELAAFDHDASIGEALDPKNAYFPFMRSIGLFAAHKDAEAMDALQRASQKRVWNDYCTEELDGEWKLHQEAFGQVSALPRMMFAFGILFPHYIQLRSATRVAIAKAAQNERAGRIEEGLKIREAVRRCGSLMRVQSTTIIGSFVGSRLNQESMSRPCGAPAIRDRPRGSREQRAREFDAYLKRIGHAEKMADWHAETEAGDRAREIVQSSYQTFLDTVPVNLAFFWIAAIILLANAFWILALGGIASLVSRCRLIRSGQGLPPESRLAAALGITAGVLAGMRLAVMGMLHKEDPTTYALLAGALLLGIVALAISGAKCPVWFRRMGVFLLGMASTALLCSLFTWHIVGSVQPIVRIIWGMAPEGLVPAAPVIQVLCVGLAATIPLLSLIVFSVLSRMWRVPLSVGVVRGLRGCGVPIACLLLLAYGILVPFIVRQELALDDGLERTVHHEGRFVAELAGQRWPGDR